MTMKGTFGYKPPQPFAPAILTDEQARQALWAPYYHNRETQLGATASLVNFGDTSNFGATSAATGTGKKYNASGLSPVWTPSTAMSGWATAFDLSQAANWQGIAPFATFNGASNNLTTPDVDFFSRVDTGGVPVSIGGWINFPTQTGGKALFSKYAASVNGEYVFYVAATTGKLTFLCRDASAAIQVDRTSDAGLSINTWYFVVVTYDGAGGATAMNTAIIYVNGVVVASTATNNAGYVSMENLGLSPTVGGDGASGWWNGKIAGGPFCPFYVQAELTAAQVANLYQIERFGLGV